MRKLLISIISGISGIWLASQFIQGFLFTGKLGDLILIGVVLGLANYFIKPLLNLISLPIRLLSFGVSSFFINLAILWGLDFYFPQIKIQDLASFFWTAILILILNFIISFIGKEKA